jgi:hypothetical protein
VCALGLSLAANDWVNLSLAFLPVFFSGIALTAFGVMLIRVYHDEVKERDVSYSKVIRQAFGNFFTASYFFLPIVLAYLLLWVVLGCFFLIKEIPFIGDFFNVILAFGPFLLILGSLLLCLASLFLLFLAAPIIALKSLSGESLLQYVQGQLKTQIFLRVTLCSFALLPLLLLTLLLWAAAKITTVLYVASGNHLQMVLQWFFIMIPFAVILSPALVFFFNVAAETHVLVQKRS